MRRIFTLLVGCVFITTLSAQNFTKFDATDGSGVKALNGLAFRSTNITILVPESFDLSNVVLDCAVATTDEIETNPLPTNFTTPQTIVTKTTATGADKTWTVDFKKVKSESLPLALAFSNSGDKTTDWTVDTKGWAGAAIDPGFGQVVRYGNTSVTFITAFSDAAKKVSFELNTVGANPFGEGVFDVLSSEDGVTWKSELSFNSANPLLNTATPYDFIPTAGVRFVKWVYTKRTVNVNLNNISIEKSDATGITDQNSTKDNIYVSNNEIVLFDASSVSKVEIYSAIGSLVQTINKPNSNINLSSLAKGIYVAKTTSATGKSVVLKFVVK